MVSACTAAICVASVASKESFGSNPLTKAIIAFRASSFPLATPGHLREEFSTEVLVLQPHCIDKQDQPHRKIRVIREKSDSAFILFDDLFDDLEARRWWIFTLLVEVGLHGLTIPRCRLVRLGGEFRSSIVRRSRRCRFRHVSLSSWFDVPAASPHFESETIRSSSIGPKLAADVFEPKSEFGERPPGTTPVVKLVMLPTWIAVLPVSMSPPWIALVAWGATDVDSGGAIDVDSGVLSTWIAGFCFLILSGAHLELPCLDDIASGQTALHPIEDTPSGCR